MTPPQALKGQPAQSKGAHREVRSLLGVDFDPHFVQANLVCARVPPHSNQHLRKKDLEIDGVELQCGFSLSNSLQKTSRPSLNSDRWADRSSGWMINTYSVVLPLNHFIRFCGFGRHLQPARSSCFQLFDLSDRSRSWSSSADAEPASLRHLSTFASHTPLRGRICGGTSLRAPPCNLQRGWPCPGQSPAAEWSGPWWWHRDPGWPGNPHTPEPHTMLQSPGSFPGSKATKRGHHCRTKEGSNRRRRFSTPG